MKKLLLLIPLPLLNGCVSMVGVAEHLKNDPATVDMSAQTIYGSFTFHRSFPTNWTPPAYVISTNHPAQ